MRRKESQRFELVLDPQRIAWIPKGGAGWPALGHRFSCSRSSKSSASSIDPEPVHKDIQLNARQDGLDDSNKAARRSTEQTRSFLFSDGRRAAAASEASGILDQSRVGPVPCSRSSRQECNCADL